jgi:hypothetical protein
MPFQKCRQQFCQLLLSCNWRTPKCQASQQAASFSKGKNIAEQLPIQVLKAILPSNNLAANQHLDDTID